MHRDTAAKYVRLPDDPSRGGRTAGTSKGTQRTVTERTGRKWNVYDVSAVAAEEKVTKANNEFHYRSEKTRRRQNSEKFVDLIERKLGEDQSYLDRAKQSYSAAQKANARQKAMTTAAGAARG